uniref:Tr-type G domain-containing protein n=1 Tax=Schistocephalus solidus TaxID=70667 RepID=A0A0X3PX20_SCHSO
MSRHRNLRRLNSDDYNTYDDLVPSSVDDDYGISPNTAGQFFYGPSGHVDGSFLPSFTRTPLNITEEEFPDQNETLAATKVSGRNENDDASMLELQFDDLILEGGADRVVCQGVTTHVSPTPTFAKSDKSIRASDELNFDAFAQLAGLAHLPTESPFSLDHPTPFVPKTISAFTFLPRLEEMNQPILGTPKCADPSSKTLKAESVPHNPLSRLGSFFRAVSCPHSRQFADSLVDLMITVRRIRPSIFLKQSENASKKLPHTDFSSPPLIENKPDTTCPNKKSILLPHSRNKKFSRSTAEKQPTAAPLEQVKVLSNPTPQPPLSEIIHKCDDPIPKTPNDTRLNHTNYATPTKPVDRKLLVQEYEQRYLAGSEKEIINLIVVGHVDAGKSTLMGNVLYQLGHVSSKQLAKYQWEAQKLGKASFAYAWVLDQTSEERTRGITMDIAQTAFETNRKRVVLLDAPGHRDFVPQVIGGAAQADVALLVVNATAGEFETGMQFGGQTQEHARLVRLLGVSCLIVVVNKMDTVSWSEERFEEIKATMLAFLKTINQTAVAFCPVSGLLGVNLINSTSCPAEADIDKLAPWYDGPCLLDIIDNLEPVERPVGGPFRFVVSDIFKPVGSSVPVVAGRIVSGAISAGVNLPTSRIICLPIGHSGAVKSIRSLSGTGDGGKVDGSLLDQSVKFAFAGDQVALILQGIDPHVSLSPGDVICDQDNPVPVSSRIRARLLVFAPQQPITRGYPVIFYYHCSSVPATITKLLSATLKEKKAKKDVVKPRCLLGNCTAEVEITFERPICLETYDTCKSLGRFMLRVAGDSIAGGTVLTVSI